MPESRQQPKISQKLQEYITNPNIAESIKDDELVKIGNSVCEGVKFDENSLKEWFERLKNVEEIAKQLSKAKNTPWPNASNIKYPLILQACIHFNARVMPEICQGDRVVYVDAMKSDPQGLCEERAKRLGAHMSYQLLGKSGHWFRDTDKLLMVYPLTGMVFRKSFYNEFLRKPDTVFCSPYDVIVNYSAKSLEEAQRITHKLYFTNNQLIERMRLGLFTKYDLDELQGDETVDTLTDKPEDQADQQQEYEKENKLHMVYEQHAYIDLDDDDYKEPYIITVHAATKKVLRIVARFDHKSFIFNEKTGRVVRIEPINYFTDYPFLPSPDGGFYGIGFGQILYPLNETINSTINQLLDAGTLANRGGGLIGNKVRLKKEKIEIKMGEFQLVNTGGVDLKANVVPYPVPEPSSVLFQLLGMMVDAGQQLAATTDIMQGDLPGANTSPTTVLAMIEQGTKVFSSIMVRLYDSFKREFEKLYDLNKRYFTDSEFFKNSVASGMITKDDYLDDDFGIFPVANPEMATDAQRLARANVLMSLRQDPLLDPHKILKKFFDAIQESDGDELFLPPPDPNAPPPPDVQKIMAEIDQIKAETADLLVKRELESIRLNLDEIRLKIEGDATVGNLDVQTANMLVSVGTALSQGANIGAAAQIVSNIDRIDKQEIQQLIPSSIEDRLTMLENIFGQQMGIQSQMPQMQSQGSPDGMGDIGKDMNESGSDAVKSTAGQDSDIGSPERIPMGGSGIQAPGI